jgi:succinyl-CoA synthetase beta subunit
VQAILVNIFAGINRCDWVAEGVVQALQANRSTCRWSCALPGPMWRKGQKILAKSGLPIIRANLMERPSRAVAAWKSTCRTTQPEGR